ncbi:hypothetical protein MCEMRE130_00148 [Candidatus Nanopelagicaceae bacterium]|jgi:hypothetical protein
MSSQEIAYLIPVVLAGLGIWYSGKSDDYTVDPAVQSEYAKLSNRMFIFAGLVLLAEIVLFNAKVT